MKIVRTASLGSNFTGFYKKRLYLIRAYLSINKCKTKLRESFLWRKDNYVNKTFHDFSFLLNFLQRKIKISHWFIYLFIYKFSEFLEESNFFKEKRARSGNKKRSRRQFSLGVAIPTW